MRFRPKTARRLLLLGIAVIFLFGAAVGLIVVRKWQNDRRTQQMRAVGMDMFKQENYPAVIDNLGRYLRRRGSDREAWLAYAKARELTVERDGSHLVKAIGAYEKALALDPPDRPDRPTAIKLLHLYNTVGHFIEARDLAGKLRPKDIQATTDADTEVLREEAAARVGLKAFDATLDKVTEKLVALDPTGYRSALLRVSFLNESRRGPEALQFARDHARAGDDDHRFDVLAAVIQAQQSPGADTKPLREVACTAAALDPTDGSDKAVGTPTYSDQDFALQLVTLFDALHMYSQSIGVLRDGAERLKSPEFKALFVRRLWQAGRTADLMAYLATLDTGEKGADSELIAFRALTAFGLGNSDDAKAMLEALKVRKRDATAHVWASALAALIEEKDPKQSLKQIEGAIKDDSAEPVFVFLRGATLYQLGRSDEARAMWRAVSGKARSTGWVWPVARISQTLLAEGRLDEAAHAADEAWAIDAQSSDARTALIQARIAIIESGRVIPDPGGMLNKIEALNDAVKANPDRAAADRQAASLLPSRVILLSAAGKPDAARELVRGALRTDPPPGAETIRRLAVACVRAKLGLDEECFAAAAKAGAARDPQSAVTQAVLIYRNGKRAEAMALMRPEPGLDAERASDWRLARAQFLDAVGEQGALDAWREISDEYPDMLSVQQTAIRAECVSQDPALVEKIVSRIVALGGSDPDHPSVAVRLARAKALLAQSPPTQRTRDEAVAILRGLAIDVPDMMSVREALIRGLLMDAPQNDVRPDTAAAIEQLTAAAAIAADRAPFIIQLATLLDGLGRDTEAASELSKLALDQAATEQGRLTAIDMLVRQRELETARLALETLVARAGSDPPVELLSRQAAVLFTLRRDREAKAAYLRLLGKPIVDPDMAVDAASALRALGEEQGANQIIAPFKADQSPDKQCCFALARYAERASDKAEAQRLYLLATTLYPSDPEVWTRLARFHLAQSDFAAASDAVKKGLDHVPDDAGLAVVLQQVSVAQSGASDPDLTKLAEALAKSPGTARRAEALLTLQKARADGTDKDPKTLASIADKYEEDLSTQLFVGRRLLELGPAGMSQAAGVVKRAMGRFPSEIEVVRLGVDVAAASGDWSSMLKAAEAWRQLSRSADADLAVAEAQLALNLPRQASDLVRGFKIPETIADSDRISLGVLNIRARASVMLGDSDAARLLLEKPMAQSSIVRTKIALPIATSLVPNATEAGRWIAAIAAKTDPQSVAEQLAVARAWAVASDRFSKERSGLIDHAIAVTDPLLGSEATTTPEVLALRADLFNAKGDTARAIATYREALIKDAKSANAMIGLARTLLATGGDPAEVAIHARRAGELLPGSAVPVLLSAQASLKQSELRAAAGDQAGRDAGRAHAKELLEKLKTMPGSSAETLADAAILAEGLDDLPAAVALYEQVLSSPDAPAGMALAATKNNLAFALCRRANGPSAPKDLTRARTLAEEAIQSAEIAPFYDTLGAIAAAQQDRTTAITAYRKAISLDAKSLSATVGLANLLSQGGDGEKQEAAALVNSIDGKLKAGATISDFSRGQYDQVKGRLSQR